MIVRWIILSFKKFMKRLRKRFKGKRIRFYMCGEYGEQFDRPHFHACIFGVDFPDKVLFLKPAVISFGLVPRWKVFGSLAFRLLVRLLSKVLHM